jgi:hypothetical protein
MAAITTPRAREKSLYQNRPERLRFDFTPIIIDTRLDAEQRIGLHLGQGTVL